jgi:hypothetical protein
MQLPFTAEQFFQVFRTYNEAVWPAQVLLHVLALMALGLVFLPRRWSGAIVSAILAGLWAWLGLAYHLAFFAAINPLAYVFAGFSVAAAAVFLWQGVVRRRLEFRWSNTPRAIAGLTLVAFALVVYPAWTTYSGHVYPALPTFGLPCPTTLFTLGLMGLAVSPYPRSPLVIPVAWCFVGAQASFLLDVQADLSLIVAGLFGIVLLVRARFASTLPFKMP